MGLIHLPTDHLRYTRFGQELLAEGRHECEARGRAFGQTAFPFTSSIASAVP